MKAHVAGNHIVAGLGVRLISLIVARRTASILKLSTQRWQTVGGRLPSR
jgi:hypothetical protein